MVSPKPQLHCVWVCICMVRTFKIYYLSNFHIQYNIVNYNHHTLYYIHRTYVFYDQKFVFFGHINPHTLPPYPVITNLLLVSMSWLCPISLKGFTHSFLSIFFFFLLHWLNNLSDLPSSSLIISSAWSSLLLKLSTEFFSSGFVFFRCRISICVIDFLIVSISALNSFCSCTVLIYLSVCSCN